MQEGKKLSPNFSHATLQHNILDSRRIRTRTSGLCRSLFLLRHRFNMQSWNYFIVRFCVNLILPHHTA